MTSVPAEQVNVDLLQDEEEEGVYLREETEQEDYREEHYHRCGEDLLTKCDGKNSDDATKNSLKVYPYTVNTKLLKSDL